MQKFNIHEASKVLEQTPKTLNSFLKNLSDKWIFSNEGEKTWSPYDIIGHLIHREKHKKKWNHGLLIFQF